MRTWPALIIDVGCIALFAAVGRSSHGEPTNLVGVADTAWPFLVGCLVGLVLSRGWQRPMARSTALVLWAATVVGGMLLRLVSGAGVQFSFVIVTAIVLAVLLLGWRGILTLVQRARARSGHRAAA